MMKISSAIIIRRGGSSIYTRVSSSTFNVTFIKLCIKVSRVFTFTPKFTAREKKQIKVDARAFAVREEESRAELLSAH